MACALDRHCYPALDKRPPGCDAAIDGGLDARQDTAYDGPREAAYDGPREAAYDGPREASYDGPREAAYDAPREAALDGPGEAALDGPGEAALDGPGEAALDAAGDVTAEGLCPSEGGCDDLNPCTVDDCDPATGCTHVPDNAVCDDGRLCTGVETCSTVEGCMAGIPPGTNDVDADDFSIDGEDCDDCDPLVNPGAFDFVDSLDNDCDGDTDAVAWPCDDALALDSVDPNDGACAIDLCQTTTGASSAWGLLAASYVRANGTPASPGQTVGLLSDFGPNVAPLVGNRLLALSSGFARLPSQPGACGSESCTLLGTGSAPSGFPQTPDGCPSSADIFDDVGLEISVRAPTNASAFAVRFSFYAFDYPEWVCTSYNDQFVILVDPAPAGSWNGNVAADANGNPVSVNGVYFAFCAGCSSGTYALEGTGFDIWDDTGVDDAGATGWLHAQVPVDPGQEYSIRFAIWDTGDIDGDATVVIDAFEWIP